MESGEMKFNVGGRSCISLDFGVDLAMAESKEGDAVQITSARKYKSIQDTMDVMNKSVCNKDVSKECPGKNIINSK